MPSAHAGTSTPFQPIFLDEYRVLHPLGAGGMGQVFLARDERLERLVAIKLLTVPVDETSTRELLRSEARAAARLQHPNVASVYRFGEVQGRPYLVTEFVPGSSLAELQKPLPSPEALDIATGLAAGLAEAHRHGVLHRDIKPSNVVRTPGGLVKVVDFGLAKLAGLSSTALAAQLNVEVDPEADTLSRLPVLGNKVSGLCGTPAYMAPELWRGEPTSARSDIYSFGALLFELCAGAPPYGPSTDLATLLRFHTGSQAVAPLASVARGVDRRLALVVDRCLQQDPERRFRSFDEVRDALGTEPRRPRLDTLNNPYCGLQAFDLDRRAFFFGRETETDEVLERLRADPFVLVAGDSGVGKSSLCRASVVARVLEGQLGAGRWTSRTLLPGRHPVAQLCAQLAAHYEKSTRDVLAWLGDGGDLVARLDELNRGSERLLLFVDQLEELVTQATPGEAAHFGAVLRRLAEHSSTVKVLATVRGDFLARVASATGLENDVWRSVYLLGPLKASGLREAIAAPALVAGTRFESDALVDRLAGDVSGAPGALPLLQFALAELWERRDRELGLITWAALDALGGVQGALTRHADRTIAELLVTEQELARRLLLQLVTAEHTRIRRLESELVGQDATGQAILERLVRARLLVAHDERDERSIEIAHEALAQSWSRLREWVRAEAERTDALARLSRAAREWSQSGRPTDALWGAQALRRLPKEPQAAGLTNEFLAASRTQATRRRLVWTGAALGLVALSVTLGGAVYLETTRALTTQANQALEQARGALGRADALERDEELLRTRAFSQFQSMRGAQAEQSWSQVTALRPRIERELSAAAQAFEKALALRPGRTATSAQLAGLLYRRALRADRDGAAEPRDELLGRLAVHDRDERYRRLWTASATLTVDVEPNTHLELERYEPTGGLMVAVPARVAIRPRRAVELEPGSYRVTLSAPGRATVRYPVLLERGAPRTIALELPRADEVPAGFAFVPPGSFLVGTLASEEQRAWLQAVPRQSARTDAFLIAQKETTFGEWLSYLDALPPHHRDQRRPRSAGEAIDGLSSGDLLALSNDSGQWRLTASIVGARLRANANEPVRLVDRPHNRELDWLRLPVVGVSADDARAYAAWLDATGRVRGARLCTDLEWERAASGADGRAFPHGDRLDPSAANIDETYGRRRGAFGPDMVGSHPESQSPFGVEDLAGNVWEWTASSFEANGSVIRGGGYYHSAQGALVANRQVTEPGYRDLSTGVRICATPRPPQAPQAQEVHARTVLGRLAPLSDR